jgi:hypothetical protein
MSYPLLLKYFVSSESIVIQLALTYSMIRISTLHCADTTPKGPWLIPPILLLPHLQRGSCGVIVLMNLDDLPLGQ